jgi:hypothetical protein
MPNIAITICSKSKRKIKNIKRHLLGWIRHC